MRESLLFGLGLALLGCGSVQGGNSSGSAGTSLAGTWEVVGSRFSGTPESVLVELSPSKLMVTASRGSLSAVANGDSFDVTYQTAGRTETTLVSIPYTDAGVPQPPTVTSMALAPAKFAAQRAAGPGNTGIIPLPLFGVWDAHAAGESGCSVEAKPDSFSATCTAVESLPWVPNLNGQLNASRTRTLASQFGDFGGEWTLTTSRGSACTIRFEGATVSSSCENAPGINGTASLTLDGNTGHGQTSVGIEFTVQRR